MFENDLKTTIARIFDLNRVTFDDPGESNEQECQFIRVSNPRVSIAEKRQRAQVEGQLVVYANSDKLPFGYFNKQIAKCLNADSLKFFFHNIDVNVPITNNIVKRTVDFVFFYDSQFDPNQGTITSVNFQEGDTE